MTETLETGINVKIQRSNGRVHDATVSSVNLVTKIVTVEWSERGEMKGKEIDFPALMDINPDLILPRRENLRSRAKRKPRITEAVRPQPQAASSPRLPSPKAVRNDQGVNGMPRQSTSLNEPKGRVAGGRPPRMKAVAPGPPKLPSVVQEEGHSQAQVPEKEKKEGKGGLALGAARRRSNCVKEVEKIRKQRDERRAKQASMMHRREDQDTSHPNWEFLQMIIEYKSQLNIQPVQMTEPAVPHRISVCVRKRPINKKELAKKDIDVVTNPDKAVSLVHECKLKVDLTKYLENHSFRFDYSFNENATNEIVYKYTAQPLVATIFERGMATCFAYGQTGSGKTHTMGGDFHGKEQDCTRGIYAFAARDVFALAAMPKNKAKDLTVCCSFFEIYSGKVYDLLNKKVRLSVLEDGNQVVQVVGLQEISVSCVDDVLELIQSGNVVRTSGTTSANQHSSRSHAIFQIILRKRASLKLYGKFSLIDLAGNERASETSSANRQTRMEGAEINKSLLALKECIRALGRKGAHLPFRASKLTQVLRDSFIGDRASTCMIAMISPGLSSCEHTLNTLRYADRVKELEVGASVGVGGHGAAAPSNRQDLVKENGSRDIPAPARSPIDSDLVLLHHSLKDDQETSAELLTFHEAVSHLLEAQDLLVDDHKTLIQDFKDLTLEEEQLVELVDDPDYDVENYVTSLEDILEKKLTYINQMKEKVNVFKKQLQDEEDASKKVK